MPVSTLLRRTLVIAVIAAALLHFSQLVPYRPARAGLEIKFPPTPAPAKKKATKSKQTKSKQTKSPAKTPQSADNWTFTDFRVQASSKTGAPHQSRFESGSEFRKTFYVRILKPTRSRIKISFASSATEAGKKPDTPYRTSDLMPANFKGKLSTAHRSTIWVQQKPATLIVRGTVTLNGVSKTRTRTIVITP